MNKWNQQSICMTVRYQLNEIGFENPNGKR